jgi:hypothetical protein
VLFLAGENPDDVRMRWIKLCEQMRIDTNAVDVFFVSGSLALSNTVLRQKIMEASKAHGPFSLVSWTRQLRTSTARTRTTTSR